MPLWTQHLLVLTLTAICLLLVARQLLGSLRGEKNHLGSCCSKGCEPIGAAKKQGERVVFMPVEMLSKRR